MLRTLSYPSRAYRARPVFCSPFSRAISAPSTSPVRLRALSWHVADVPGVQGYWELRSLKVWKFSFYAAPSVAPQGRSVLCSPFSGRPCRPSPAGALLHLLNLLCAFASPSGTSQTCRGCRENFSLPGRGAAPHTFQSLILPILLCSLWLLVPFVGKQSGSPACASTPSICNKSAKSAVPILAVLCVLCGSSCSL